MVGGEEGIALSLMVSHSIHSNSHHCHRPRETQLLGDQLHSL